MYKLAVVFVPALLFALWTVSGVAAEKTGDYQTTYVTEKCKGNIIENEEDFFTAHIICRKTYTVSDWRCEVTEAGKGSFECVQSLKAITKYIFGSRRNVMGALCGFCP